MSQKFTHPQGCKMSSPTKSGSQPCGWQIASSRDSFCDFGRKLETLRMPVRNIVLCWPWRPRQPTIAPGAHLGRTRHSAPTWIRHA